MHGIYLSQRDQRFRGRFFSGMIFTIRGMRGGIYIPFICPKDPQGTDVFVAFDVAETIWVSEEFGII